MNKNIDKFKQNVLWVIIGLVIIVLILIFTLFKKKPTETSIEQNLSEEPQQGEIYEPIVDPPTVEDEGTPSSAADYYSLGSIQFQNGNYQEAKINFESAIALNPNNANYYAKKSEAQYNLGNKEEAIQTVKDGLVALPDNDFLKTKLDILNKEWFGNQPQ